MGYGISIPGWLDEASHMLAKLPGGVCLETEECRAQYSASTEMAPLCLPTDGEIEAADLIGQLKGENEAW